MLLNQLANFYTCGPAFQHVSVLYIHFKKAVSSLTLQYVAL